jgi:uncharacterized membrane protein
MSQDVNLNDVVEVRSFISNAEQVAENVWHVACIAAGTPPLIDLDVGVEFGTLLALAYKSIITSNSNYLGTITRVLNRVPTAAAVKDQTLHGVGTVTPPDAPRQSSGIISWFTAFAGRKYRGRQYIPFPPTSVVQGDGTPGSGYVTVLTNIATALTGPINISVGARTGTIQLCVYHRSTKTYTLILGGVGVTKFATQRRRGSYGRPNISPF